MVAPFMYDSASGNEARFAVIRKQEDRTIPMHWHSELELMYVLSGEQDVFINGEKVTLLAGDGLLLNSGDRHLIFPGNGASRVNIIFSMDILDGTPGAHAVKRDLQERFDILDKTTLGWKSEGKAFLRNIIGFILEADDERGYDYEIRIRSGIFFILCLFGDDRVNPRSANPVDRPSRKADAKMEKVFTFIGEHYSDRVTLNMVASAVGYVPTYFSHVFKAFTGMTFYDYLTSYRVMRAMYLLSSTSMSIAEIATRVGFRNVKTFDRAFKDHNDISPLRYRKQQLAIAKGRA